jgi:hypothetical protein
MHHNASAPNSNANDGKRSELGSPWTLPGDSEKSSSNNSDSVDEEAEAQARKEQAEAEAEAAAPKQQTKQEQEQTKKQNLLVDTNEYTPDTQQVQETKSKSNQGELQLVQQSSSNVSNVSDMVSQFTGPRQIMDDLDDILGSKGQEPPHSPSYSGLPVVSAKAKVNVNANATTRTGTTEMETESIATDKAVKRTTEMLMDTASIATDKAVKSPKNKNKKNPEVAPDLLAATQKEIEALTLSNSNQKPAPMDIQTTTSTTSTLGELQQQNLDSIVAGLHRFEKNMTKPQPKGPEPAEPSPRQFIGPAGSSVSEGTSFESATSFPERGSFWGSSRADSMSNAETTFSRGDTLSPGSTTVSRSGTLSPGATSHSDTLSPRSQSQGVLSHAGLSVVTSVSNSDMSATTTSVSHNGTFTPTSVSRNGTNGTLSPGGPSVATSVSNSSMSLGGTTTTSVSHNDTFTPTSRDGTLSPGGTTFSRGDTFSPTSVSRNGTNGTLSPGGPSVATSVSNSSMSLGGTTTTSVSHNDTFTPTSRDGTLSPGGTTFSRGDTFSPTSVSRNGTDGTDGTFSPGGPSVATYTASPRQSSQRGGESTPSRISEEEHDEQHQQPGGGRLWELANQEAEKMKGRPISPEATRFAESLMVRTRSRADPDAVLVAPSASVDPDSESRPNMIRISEQDEQFIVHTALARKRVRVVQLLLVGLFGLLVAFLGSFWVQSSCHFVSASVEVGQNSQVFELHYGLWKYTPIDSAFQGYSYCYQYDNTFTSDAPFIPRIASCIALFCGAFSLSVLWAYLIFGLGKQSVWNVAVFSAALSGALQLSTLSIFAGEVCQRDICTLGPAGILSVVASMVYFILAFEMHYNTPMAAWVTDIAACPSREEPGNLMVNLEMTDFQDGAKAYVSRIVDGDANPYPSLNQIQRDNANPIGEAMFDRGFNKSTYKPPALIV